MRTILVCPTIAVLAGSLSSCAEEPTKEYTPVPSSLVEVVHEARESCLRRADASPILPRINALLAAHEDAIAQAVTNASDFSLVFADGAIAVTGSTLLVATEDFVYTIEYAARMTVTVSGVFSYSEESVGETDYIVECAAGAWEYRQLVSQGGLHGPGERSRTIHVKRMDDRVEYQAGWNNSDWKGRYCWNGICRPVYTERVPKELDTTYFKPATAYVTDEIRDFLLGGRPVK